MTFHFDAFRSVLQQMWFRFLCRWDELQDQAPPEDVEEFDAERYDDDPRVWAEEHADEDDLEDEGGDGEEGEAGCSGPFSEEQIRQKSL